VPAQDNAIEEWKRRIRRRVPVPRMAARRPFLFSNIRFGGAGSGVDRQYRYANGRRSRRGLMPVGSVIGHALSGRGRGGGKADYARDSRGGPWRATTDDDEHYVYAMALP
jgi:hypothetical protein